MFRFCFHRDAKRAQRNRSQRGKPLKPTENIGNFVILFLFNIFAMFGFVVASAMNMLMKQHFLFGFALCNGHSNRHNVYPVSGNSNDNLLLLDAEKKYGNKKTKRRNRKTREKKRITCELNGVSCVVVSRALQECI